MSSFKIPVLFLIFNRPELTKKVFQKIRENKPIRLYVAADGPRDDRPEENKLCDETRKIIEKVDWDCEVKTLFRERNLGLRKAVSEALDWFFENEEMGIILEDDCVPANCFFTFCEKLLHYYKDDERIMHISGDNFLDESFNIAADYYFGKIMHCWGWASWRRAWKKFDKNLDTYEKFKSKNIIKSIFNKESHQNCWIKNFDRVYEGIVSSWAWVWMYSILINNGLCINPCQNLVSNIGFGEFATHTLDKNSSHFNINSKEIDYQNIKHPGFFFVDPEHLDYLHKVCCGVKN